MLVTLYPVFFLIAVLALTLWYFQQSRGKNVLFVQLLLLAALIGWAASLYLSAGAFQVKLPLFIRDMVMMAGVPYAMQMFAKNKIAFAFILAALLGIYYGFGWDIWEESLRTAAVREETRAANNDNTFELLTEIKNGKQAADLQAIADKYDLIVETAFTLANGADTDLDDYVAVDIPAHNLSRKQEIIDALNRSGLTDWTEENETVNLDDPVTHLKKLPAVNKKFGVNDPDLGKQWALEKLGADKLYKLLADNKIRPQRKARIFILDTGVDATHEDLADRYLSHKKKYDTDKQGHGTHCAGIASAVTHNNKGIASLSPDNDFTQITSIKVLSDFGSGTQRGIINGILEAADNGADVISMSLGGRSNDSKQRAYKQAVAYAQKAGAVVIVAAGNGAANAKNFAPAGAPGVICVSAVDTLLRKANFSNSTQDVKMGIAAPGTLIHSTFPDNKYVAFNGTSMATPYVAGLAGILKSLQPDLTTKEIYKILKESGTDTANTELTGKFIQPAAAVKMLVK